DKTFRVWLMAADGDVSCMARGLGHVQAVGALSCSRMKENFVVTGSQDLTIKVWYLPETLLFMEKSDVEKLDARKPASEKTDAGKPDKEKTEAGKPDKEKTEAGKPDKEKTDAGKPDKEKKDAGKPDKEKKDAGKPDKEKTDAGKPDKEKTDAVKPDKEKKDAVKPDNKKPDAGKPDARAAGTQNPAAGHPGNENTKTVILQPHLTEKAHDKDINSVAVSPNDKLIATGSQDRTAKLWTSNGCVLLGVFQGHRRGIWCVQFSPVDQVLATSSADGTVKIWDLQDFSCLKTFEGHDSSVLKVIFVSQGGQVLSSDSDGLLKLWTMKNCECVKTLDGHCDKVWGLHANKKDNMLVTGASDSRVMLWKDVTRTELEEQQAKQEEQLLREQELSNLLHEKRYLEALASAISLDRPHTVLTVVKGILKETGGKEDLEKSIKKLRKDQKEALLRFSVTWNTNSRNCHEAQAVIGTLLRHETPESLLEYEGIKAAVESLLPYTERHFQRLGRLLQASMFLDFMWQSMRLPDGSKWEEEMDT
ncbi:Transducin beta-like protein 3, partial [Varanus komodoensis]